jgi:glycosyltransferase involved in cell wall biosynthesis
VRILHVWRRPYPFDIRVQKISRTLGLAGHEVHIAATNSGSEPEAAPVEGLTVHRLPPLPGPLQQLGRLTGYPSPWNPRWMAGLRRICARVQPEALLVRDIHLMPLCARTARRLGIPIVLDLPENWPALWTVWRETEGINLQNVLTRSVRLCRRAERAAVRAADHVLVCVEEMRDRLLTLGVPEQRITLVRNTPDLDRYPRLDAAQQDRAARIRAGLGADFVIAYGGEVEPFRGLDTLLHALALLRPTVPGAKLLLVGPSKGGNKRKILAVAARLGVTDAVLFTGWLEQADLLDHVLAADVGAATFYACEQFETTLTNKLFDYMSLGKPVLATDVRPMRRILEECACGLLVPSRDGEAAAAALRRLLDPRYRQQLGENGIRAVRDKYQWAVSDGPAVARLFAALPRRDEHPAAVATVE